MKYILIFFCFISSSAYSQSVTKEKIYGTWICKTVSLSQAELLTPEEKAMGDKIKDSFMDGKFTFGADGIFNIELPKASPELLEMVKDLDKKIWQLKGNRISISPKENLMHLDVMNGDGFLTFGIFETPFVLRMEKM